ncbi:MAG: CDP-diacylglycerol--serine O-phosphatidyltransferase [Phycisphaeraceae bacterium]|nr:CDP-diacylglycerol--serine O-phosphatidyltransferase [Phycisphaeraceae bacterium]
MPSKRNDSGESDPFEAPRRTAAQRSLAVLPTLCTLGNCLCGFLAVFFASRKPETQMAWNWTPLTVAAAFVFLGMLFDALDGRLARLTRHTSDLGAQLDSMADMVTFGVAPAFIAVQLVALEAPFMSIKADRPYDRMVLVIACIYVSCAALRLARFNIEIGGDDVSHHTWFEGLPTPGAGGTVASLVLLHEHFLANQRGLSVTLSSIGMVAITLLAAIAMVSRLPYVHLINRFLRDRARIEYIAIAVAIGLLLFVHPQGSLAAAFVIYALSAPIVAMLSLLGRRRKADD